MCKELTNRVRVHHAVGVVSNGTGIQAGKDAQLAQALRQNPHRQVVHVPQLCADPAGLDALPAQPASPM